MRRSSAQTTAARWEDIKRVVAEAPPWDEMPVEFQNTILRIFKNYGGRSAAEANEANPPPYCSPWMTIEQTATYARVPQSTVAEALGRFVSSSGWHGLRGDQRMTNGSWRIHRDDADRWLRGALPIRCIRLAA
ncbi:MAG TPA: hypothetical protein VGX25_23055 [Actinophytocola sp.]|nr:hypothetical protein [Actinophytocola sp.]